MEVSYVVQFTLHTFLVPTHRLTHLNNFSVNRLPFHIQNIIIMVVMKLAIINKSQIWDSYIRVPMHMIQITSISY